MDTFQSFTNQPAWSAPGGFTRMGPWQVLDLNAFTGFQHQPGWHTLEYVAKYRLHRQETGMPTSAYVYQGRMAPISAPPRIEE